MKQSVHLISLGGGVSDVLVIISISVEICLVRNDADRYQLYAGPGLSLSSWLNWVSWSRQLGMISIFMAGFLAPHCTSCGNADYLSAMAVANRFIGNLVHGLPEIHAFGGPADFFSRHVNLAHSMLADSSLYWGFSMWSRIL